MSSSALRGFFCPARKGPQQVSRDSPFPQGHVTSMVLRERKCRRSTAGSAFSERGDELPVNATERAVRQDRDGVAWLGHAHQELHDAVEALEGDGLLAALAQGVRQRAGVELLVVGELRAAYGRQQHPVSGVERFPIGLLVDAAASSGAPGLEERNELPLGMAGPQRGEGLGDRRGVVGEVVVDGDSAGGPQELLPSLHAPETRQWARQLVDGDAITLGGDGEGGGGRSESTRLNSSHVRISYAVFCLKKKTA